MDHSKKKSVVTMVFLQYLYNVLSILSCSLFLMMMMNNLVFAGPTGFSLKLIHSDSLYPGKLTQLERMERAFQQSIDREQQLTSLDGARPRVSHASKLYMVEIGIGSFPNPIYYKLLIDTGSDLLWLQCKGNKNLKDYFPQDDPPFPCQNSSTYQPLPVNSTHRICEKFGFRPAGRFCGYYETYGDNSSTSGVLATEKLTVNGDHGGSEVINNFAFGCGFLQRETTLGKNPQGNNPVAGILGLGGGVGSFINQLGAQSIYKFEYCLNPPYDNTPTTNTFLRFGSDTKLVVDGGQGVQSTAIISVRGPTFYYVIMEGISVGNTQVPYPNTSVFQSNTEGVGGSIFDSGCSVTQLSSAVYAPFENHLIWYFQRYGIQRRIAQLPFKLCFTRPNEQFNDFPTVTFHYNGADFVIEPFVVFTVGKRAFCLNMMQATGINSYSVILGALQQANHRILHDLAVGKIYWATETCTTVG